MRRGFTLHEMLVSLVVMGVVVAGVARVALDQARLYRGIADATALGSQVAVAGDIVGNLAWSLSPAGGDLLVAEDSAFAAHFAIGSAVVCASQPGRITIPAPTEASGAVLSAFASAPGAGDGVAALFDDSIGTTWLRFQVADAPRRGSGCASFPGITDTWELPLTGTVAVPSGAVVRISRPMRLSIYRSSDGHWYLGGRDWNASTSTFNIIQPVSGPLRALDDDPGRTGLRFGFRDHAGDGLAEPVDRSRVRVITVVARARSTHPRYRSGPPGATPQDDSVVTVVRLRNP